MGLEAGRKQFVQTRAQLIGMCGFAFPYGDDVPAENSEITTDFLVARNIPLELAPPKFPPSLWRVGKLASVTMPETAVNEYGNSMLGQNDIGFAWQD